MLLLPAQGPVLKRLLSTLEQRPRCRRLSANLHFQHIRDHRCRKSLNSKHPQISQLDKDMHTYNSRLRQAYRFCSACWILDSQKRSCIGRHCRCKDMTVGYGLNREFVTCSKALFNSRKFKATVYRGLAPLLGIFSCTFSFSSHSVRPMRIRRRPLTRILRRCKPHDKADQGIFCQVMHGAFGAEVQATAQATKW